MGNKYLNENAKLGRTFKRKALGRKKMSSMSVNGWQF
jgi:hypothetical protein